MTAEKIEAEFIDLVNRHQGIIHRVCRIYATAASDRQDLFQDILYHLWKSYPAFKHEAAFTTWMYRIALNMAITSLRKLTRKPQHVEIDETIENALKVGDDSSSDDIELLHQAIRKLNSVERALVLLYLEDLSHKEIAEVLGLTVSNVGVKLSRIKSKLQLLLQQQES